MPYKIVKQGNKYAVVNQDTGKVMGKHPSKSSAKAQLGALYANVPDAKKALTISITAKGDKRYMFLITTNAYEDRENETITSKALHEYVEKAWENNLPPQPLLFWHGGDPIGKIVWVDTEGPFLIEVAEEIPGTFTHKGLEYPVSEIWDYLQRKPEGWGASHGFDYLKSDDRTYERIAKFETSVLPIEKAANPYTFSGVIAMPQRDKVLDEILKVPGAADRLRANVKRLKNVLDGQGVQHKALSGTAEKGILEALSSSIDGLLAKISDQPLDDLKADLIQTIIGALAGTEETDESPEEQTSEDDMMKAADDAAGTATTSANPLSNPAKGKQVAYGPTSMAITKEFSDMVTGMVEAQGELADTIARLTKELADMGELRTEVKALKARMSLTPRLASRAAETVVEDAVAKKAMAEDGYEVDPVFGRLKAKE